MKPYILKYKALLLTALVFGTIFSVGSAVVALVLRDIIDIALSGDMHRFSAALVKTLLFLAVLSLCYGLYAVYSKKFICKVTAQLRASAFDGIFKKNLADFGAVNSADYLSALTNDVKNVEDSYLVPLFACLQNAVLFLTSAVVMLYLSPLVTLFLFVAMLLLIAVPGLFQKTIQRRQAHYSETQAKLTVSAKDFLSGFSVIRAYQMVRRVQSAFAGENDAVYRAKYALERTMAAVEALSAALGLAVQAGVLFVSAYLILTGALTAGALVGLVQISGTIVMPLQALSQSLPKIKGAAPIVERLNRLIHAESHAFSGTLSPAFESRIAVRDLHFGYAAAQPVLSGVSLSLQKGKKYALVGKSGCGKTTLLHLLTGSYAGYSGDILYDNTELRHLDTEKLCALSAVIHQNTYMFDGTVRDNICLYRDIPQADLQNALDVSGAALFLGDEKNLDTAVGENGCMLSGGQRQRIAVARALAQKKPLLFLDEGTSAVDGQTAYDIESRLLNAPDLTVVTVTHALRPELLHRYDRIIFMENGSIRETGTFKELMNTDGAFKSFYNIKT